MELSVIKLKNRIEREVGIRGILFIICCIAIHLFLNIPNVYAADDSDVEWLELESEHFVIHYPINREFFARRALSIAEEAHDKLSILLNWSPAEKTFINVESDLDEANGWARTLPAKMIRLYAYPPEVDSELGDYDDWIRQLIYHEYTHILHTDYTTSFFSRLFNAVMGPISKKSNAVPRWYTEGLAVYYETLTSDSGRLRNAIYRTIVRCIALDDQLPSIGSLSTGMIPWPGAGSSYIFGSHIIKYIADTYGLESLTAWNHNYGDSLLSYSINRDAVKTWGKTMEELYLEWIDHEKNRALSETLKLLNQGDFTEHHPITDAFRHRHPQPRPGYSQISYVRNNGYTTKSIVLLDTQTGKERSLVQCWGTCKHRWSDDGKTLYFIHTTSHDNYRRTDSLYKYNIETDEVTDLELHEHIRSFALDQDTMYWVVQTQEQTELYRKSPGKEYEYIYRTKPFEQIDNIVVKDGIILASVFDIENKQFDIEKIIYTPANTDHGGMIERTKITRDKSPDMAPFFCNDEKYCYVSSRSGELNLWEFDPKTQHSRRITHLMDGMMEPAQASNGDIFYTQYTSAGTTISVIHPEHFGNWEQEADRRTQTIQYPELNDVGQSSPRRYLPWEWLFPKVWSPRFAYDKYLGVQVGLSITGADTIDHHSYSLFLDYLPGKENVNFNVSYQWTGAVWSLGLEFDISQNITSYYDSRRVVMLDYQRLIAEISTSRVWNTRLASHSLHISYQLEYSEAEDPVSWSRHDPAASPVILPSLGWSNSINLSYGFSNLKQSEKAIVPNDGYQFWSGLNFEAPWLGARSYSVIGYAMGWGAWTLPWLDKHVFSTNLIAALSWSNDKRRMPFTVSSGSGFVFNTTGEDTRMHGYPSGSIYGKNYLYANANYSAVFWEPSIGYSTLPIGLNRIGATAFFDWANAWKDKFYPLRSKFDIGAKLHLDFVLGYSMPVRASLGYAWGGAPSGGHEVFFYWSTL